MSYQAFIACLVLNLCAHCACAQRADTPSPRIPAHTPEFTHPTTGDPANAGAQRLEVRRASPAESVASDLQRVVVLCATQPGSQEFADAWSEYVRTHYRQGVDVEALIDEVLRRAEAERANPDESSADQRTRAAESTTTRNRMHDTAMAVIRKIG